MEKSLCPLVYVCFLEVPLIFSRKTRSLVLLVRNPASLRPFSLYLPHLIKINRN